MINEKNIELAIKNILNSIGEDCSRKGLIDTPQRVSRMYKEIFKGMDENPKDYLKIFDCENTSDQDIITICNIPFYSMCEHHLLPFFGEVSIAYIPNDNKILGLSKFPRIVECFSRRLQIQENLSNQIITFLYDNLKPKGILVCIEAEHLCMTMRGIKSIGSKTKTISTRGIFSKSDKKKAEAIKLLKGE